MVARGRKLGALPELVSTWIGPWRVMPAAEAQHGYIVETIVTGQCTTVHVAMGIPYGDNSLRTTEKLRNVFPTLKSGGEFQMQAIGAVVLSIDNDD